MALPRVFRTRRERDVANGRQPTGPAVVVAVVGAVATALTTAVLGFGGDLIQALTPGSPSTSSAIQTRRAASPDGSIEVRIPEGWNSQPSQWDGPIARVVNEGPGLRAGLGSLGADTRNFEDPSLYLAASRGAAAQWGFAGTDTQSLAAWTRKAVDSEALDWGKFAVCNREESRVVDRSEWIGTLIKWRDCLSRAGNRRWELIAVKKDGTAVMNLGLTLPPSVDDDVAGIVLDSWNVHVSALWTKAPYAAKAGEGTLPKPDWAKPMGKPT